MLNPILVAKSLHDVLESRLQMHPAQVATSIVEMLRTQPYFGALLDHVVPRELLDHITHAIRVHMERKQLSVRTIMNEPITFSFGRDILVSTTRVLTLLMAVVNNTLYKSAGFRIADGPMRARVEAVVNETGRLEVHHDPAVVAAVCSMRGIRLPLGGTSPSKKARKGDALPVLDPPQAVRMRLLQERAPLFWAFTLGVPKEFQIILQLLVFA